MNVVKTMVFPAIIPLLLKNVSLAADLCSTSYADCSAKYLLHMWHNQGCLLLIFCIWSITVLQCYCVALLKRLISGSLLAGVSRLKGMKT